jgi:hypothetical protein
MNRFGVDFLVELGDFKDMPASESEEKALIYLSGQRRYSFLQGPILHVLGNHDVECISKEQFLSVVPIPVFPKTRLTIPSTKRLSFIVLDADYDSTEGVSARVISTGVIPISLSIELTWLKKDLRKHAAQRSFSSISNLMVKARICKQCSSGPKNSERSGKVAAVFQGHYHEGNTAVERDSLLPLRQ